MAGGLTLAAVGFAILAQAGGQHALAAVVTGYVLVSLGLAPVFTLATDLIVGTAPPEQAGAAAAIAETSSELGGALGIAMLGSIVTAVYRSVMAAPLPVGEKWFHNFRQGDEWRLCLTAGTFAARESGAPMTTAEPLARLQSEGGVGSDQGRSDN